MVFDSTNLNKSTFKRYINKKGEGLKLLKKRTLSGKYLPNPFLKSYRFHQDSIFNILPHPAIKNLVFTGSVDGEICLWMLNREKCVFNLKAHEKPMRGVSINYNGKFLISCSDDNNLKLWRTMENTKIPIKVQKSDISMSKVEFNPTISYFLTAGKSILVWDFERFVPIQKIFQKEVSLSCIKFNPVEYNILISSASDRSVMLHDLRLHSPVKKFFMEMRSNDIIWSKANPWEFTIANEDSNLYKFDIRKINHVKKTYKGHVMPVQSIDQEKTGKLIISGSLDRTIRVHNSNTNFNANIFSSSRMSRILCVSFSSDGNLILSGSEDGNLRLWKKPEKIKNSKIYQKNKIVRDTKISLSDFNRFTEKCFLPKLVMNIHNFKLKLNQKNLVKKSRLGEIIIPCSISFRDRPKKPNIDLEI